MEKKNIKKYVATGLMAAMLSTGVGLCIHDTHVDHTNEVCPITKIMNFIPNLSYFEYGVYVPTGIVHQTKQMQKDYEARGIMNPTISFGEISYPVPNEFIDDDGNINYIPDGYYLTFADNGSLVFKKYSADYGITASWGDWNGLSYENQQILKMGK